MYKISVICLVYNCEMYIRRTIQSIINQTIGFDNIEFAEDRWNEDGLLLHEFY